MSHRTICRSVGLLLVVLVGVVLAAPVSAADCGGATPCTCGDSVIASRKLVRGVDPVTSGPCLRDGLIITGWGVVLDLGWVTILGSLAEGSVGIFVATESGSVTIRNGTIARFGLGIDSVGAFDGSVLVERVEVTDNAEGGLRLSSSMVGTAIVRASMTRRNGGFGIEVVCGQIRESHAEQNGSIGIISFAPDCAGGRVFHVVSRENGGSGFVLRGDSGLIERSLAVRNAGDGFVVRANDLTMTRSMAFSNGGQGFDIGAHDSLFAWLRTKGNAGFGIRDPNNDPHFGNVHGPGNYCQGDGLGDSAPPGLCK